MLLPDIFKSKNALMLKSQVSELLETNTVSQKFGLTLSPKGALELLEERTQILVNVGRIELESSLTQKIVTHFCDSAYIQQDDYVSTLIELQEIFYDMKNETEDSLTDEELLVLLKIYFEQNCEGDLDYLRGKYLDVLSRDTKRRNQTNDFHLNKEGDK